MSFPSQIPTLALAYLGDAVIELLVRDMLVKKGLCHPKDLNKASRNFVTLEAQSDAVEKILPILTEEELSVFKRGRNSKPHTIPKHGEKIQYLRATGLETLFGHLYESGQNARIDELFNIAFSEYENQITAVYAENKKEI